MADAPLQGGEKPVMVTTQLGPTVDKKLPQHIPTLILFFVALCCFCCCCCCGGGGGGGQKTTRPMFPTSEFSSPGRFRATSLSAAALKQNEAFWHRGDISGVHTFHGIIAWYCMYLWREWCIIFGNQAILGITASEYQTRWLWSSSVQDSYPVWSHPRNYFENLWNTTVFETWPLWIEGLCLKGIPNISLFCPSICPKSPGLRRQLPRGRRGVSGCGATPTDVGRPQRAVARDDPCRGVEMGCLLADRPNKMAEVAFETFEADRGFQYPTCMMKGEHDWTMHVTCWGCIRK